MVNIDTGNGLLRSLELADAVELAAYANNQNIWNNVRDYFPHPYKLEHAVDFIQQEKEKNPPHSLAIVYEQHCIGVIGFYPMTDVYRLSADFGYWIGEPYWGKGILSAAIPAMANYIFNHFEFVRLQSGVFEFNAASMRVLEKAGFSKEGIARKAVMKGNRLVDEHRYALLRPALVK